MLSRKFILFAEDDPAQATLLALACKRCGVPKTNYAICANGIQLIELLEKAQALHQQNPCPSRIVTDFRMPLLDGMGVLSWIKGNEHYKSVPVTLMSTFFSNQDLARARSIGADEILNKAGRFDELVTHVHRWYSDAVVEPEPLSLSDWAHFATVTKAGP